MDNFDKTCAWCGTTQNLQRHHIVYRSKGGPDSDENMITLCYQHHRHVHREPTFMIRILKSLKNTQHWRWQEAYDQVIKVWG